MWRAVWFRSRDEESGVVLVIAVVLLSVIGTLSVTMLAVGRHSDHASVRGRHAVQALHIAEGGVDQAIAKIEDSAGAFSGGFTGSTEDGAFSVVVTRMSRNRYQIESTGTVRDGEQLGAKRILRVTMEPPVVFRNALFSYTTLETKNNDQIAGDIWANESSIVQANSTVTGSVTAATGYVRIEGGAHVFGSAISGGFDETGQAIFLDNNAILDGDATASVAAPPDPTTCGGATQSDYKVRLDPGSVIGGNVTTWGSVNNQGSITGVVTQNVCTSAPATIPMPAFTYSAGNYDPTTLHEFGSPSLPSATAVVDFQSYLIANGNAISGTFFINQAAPVGQNLRVDLTGVTITGDTNLITNTPIFTNNTDDAPSVTNAVVLLASTYQPPTGSSCDVNQDSSECAAHIKNNFSVCDPDAADPGTAVLIYTPYGPTAVKNNALQCGAVYADSIQIKNNQILRYDARIERMVGFGPTTLEIVKWLELSS